MLTSKQRATLRGIASTYETIFQVGKGGISDTLVQQVSDALRKRELIKMHVLDNCPLDAREAAQELAEQGRIHVVDSRQLSTGGGLLALQGAVLRDSGMAAADIAEELRRLAPHSDTSFVLDTLEYMWKGGRCSGVAALGANMLKLKPCLEMREGKLAVCKKYRGSMDKVYRQYITERLTGKTVMPDHAFITHSGEVPEDTLRQLTELVRQLAPFKEVFVTQAGCTVSSHCGPGTLGVLFLRQPAR